MLTKRIFLASSNELKDDRVAFELMIGQLNQEWVPRGTFFHLVVWENFIDAMSQDGLQTAYNQAATECDIFVLLFFTKVGKHTAAEFEAAFGAFSTGKRPLVYTYFKDAVVLTGDIDASILSLLDFKKRLDDLQHYYTRYRSSEELKWLFSRQLDKLFGDNQGLSFEIGPDTPQSQIDTVALALVNRYLSELDGRTTVDVNKLKRAVGRASELSRHTIFLLAQKVRRDSWTTDKLRMERTIPVFQALLDADRTKHYHFAQLAFALKDQTNPDWATARQHLDQALDLLDKRELRWWPFYPLARATCNVELDTDFRAGRPAGKALRKTVLDDLRVVQDGVSDFADLLNQPWNLPLRRWLQLNDTPPAPARPRARTRLSG